jgi:hypothetical protein
MNTLSFGPRLLSSISFWASLPILHAGCGISAFHETLIINRYVHPWCGIKEMKLYNFFVIAMYNVVFTSPIYRTRSHTEVKGNAKLSGNSRDGT